LLPTYSSILSKYFKYFIFSIHFNAFKKILSIHFFLIEKIKKNIYISINAYNVGSLWFNNKAWKSI
jgi:hypothetical protein